MDYSDNLPKLIDINDRISYIPPSEEPLSADVGIIRGDGRVYLFDVGSTASNLSYFNSLPDDKVIVISHFHADHAGLLRDDGKRKSAGACDASQDVSAKSAGACDGSTEGGKALCRPSYSHLYVSRFTSKYTGGEIVTDPIVIRDGVKLEISLIPATHAKGCLALTVDDEIIFAGDATYAAFIDGAPSYNAQFLKEQIAFFEASKAPTVFLSHKDRPLTDKETVLKDLKDIYSLWDKSGPYIRV